MRFNDIKFKGLLDCYLRDYSERVVQSLVSGACTQNFDTNAFARGHLPAYVLSSVKALPEGLQQEE